MDTQEKKDSVQHSGDGDFNPLGAAVGLALGGAVLGISKLCSMHEKRKWDKLAKSIKVGDEYTGFVNAKSCLEVRALEGVGVRLAIEVPSYGEYDGVFKDYLQHLGNPSQPCFADRVDEPGFETLRECYGEEQRLNAAVKIAANGGLRFGAGIDPFLDSFSAPSAKMVTVTDRKDTIMSVLKDLAKDREPLKLTVACLDAEHHTVWFCCEKIERCFIERRQKIRQGVEQATKEHAAVLACKTIQGEIVRADGNKKNFEVRLEGVCLHDVQLDEPKWSEAQRYSCLTTGYFNDYICENWLTKHEFSVADCRGGIIHVNSNTIDRALGIVHDTFDGPSAGRGFSGGGGFVPRSILPVDAAARNVCSGKIASNTRIIVDASNVVRADDKLSWRALRALVVAFERQGREFALMFDANIGHVLEEMNEKAGVNYIESLKRNLPDKVLVVPAGSQADEFILFEAEKTGAHILSRDRYRDDKFRARYKWLSEQDAQESRVHKFAIMDSYLSVPDLDIREAIVTD